MIDFRDSYVKNNIINIPTGNGNYTWNKRREGFSYIAERLDRFMFKGDMRNFDNNLSPSILPMMGFDLFPIRLIIDEVRKPIENPFKFKKMWYQDSEFLELLETWWQEDSLKKKMWCQDSEFLKLLETWRQEDSFKGSKIFFFVSKLKSLKNKILKWNYDYFKKQILRQALC